MHCFLITGVNADDPDLIDLVGEMALRRLLLSGDCMKLKFWDEIMLFLIDDHNSRLTN